MNSGLWSLLIVFSPAKPIEISLRPPEKKYGHQMRLDEPEGDVEVGFDKSPVREDGRSRSGFSQIGLFVLLFGAMGIDRMAGKDLGADDLVELALGRLTVESGGDEDADLRGGYPGPLEGADNDRQDGTVWSRASDVADGDRRRALAGCHCARAAGIRSGP